MREAPITGSVPRRARRAAGRALPLLLLLALPLLLLGLAAGPASAHATLVETDPAEGEVLDAAPEQVTLTFDEPVSLTAQAVQVFDAAGEPVEAEAASSDAVVTADLPDELDDGTYVLTYRVVSADGHPISGSLTFSVGAPSETVVAPEVDSEPPAGSRVALGVVQAVAYVGLLLAVGLVGFAVWVLAGVAVPDPAARRWQRLLRVAAAVALVGWVARVPVVAVYQQGLGLGSVLSPDAFDVGLLRDELIVTLLVVAGVATAVGLVAAGVATGARRALVTAAAAVALAAPALVGHTRAFEPVPLLVVTDVVHLLAGATWLGGLVGLTLTLPGLAGRAGAAATVLARFSVAAAVSLGLLAVTGSLLGWRIVGSWAGLFETTYGRVLLVKVGLVALVALAAGFNRFRVLPRALGAVGHEEGRRAAAAVRGVVRVEAVGVLVVVALTGFLVNQPPRPSAEAAETAPSRVDQGVVGEYKALVTLSPGTRGPNMLSLQVQDLAGEPLDVFGAPELAISSASVDLGPVTLVPVGAGTYTAEVVFPAAGQWEAQVSLRASEFENPVTTVPLTVE